ncbi:MAG: PadR family transcriptional regulator [Bacillota bacterium]|nr:PadR family transcriptional regulator [Bacillota bacterium]
MGGPDKELLRGTLELVVLSIIARQTSYGYSIINAIKQETEGRIELKEGSLYPVLYRLEDAGAIESVWHYPEERGVPRKYYRILPEGKKRLGRLRKEWCDYVRLVTLLIEGGSEGRSEGGSEDG